MRNQRGMVLIVGLVMLLLMTVIGLAAIRGSNMQELMAGNMRDRHLAFQTAEAGLRSAEETVNDLVDSTFNEKGAWMDLNVPGAARPPVYMWALSTWQTTDNAKIVDNTQYSSKPLYVIEKVAIPIGESSAADGSGVGVGSLFVVPAPDYFRVTSRASGGTQTSSVTLQSTFKTFFAN